MSDVLSQLKVLLGLDSSNLGDGLDKSLTKLTDWQGAVTKLIGGVSFAGIAAGLLEVSNQFQQASVNIQRATGASGQSLASLNASFKTLYSTTSQSADAVSQALSQIAIRSGATGQQLEALTKSALNFAKVTGADLATSVQENQRIFASWSLSTAQQAAALDVLYAAQQKSGISAEKLSSAMLTMGPILRNVGFGFTESVALIGSFERAGLDATDVTMGLNKVFSAFAQAQKDPRQGLLDLIEKMGQAENRATALNLAIDAGFNAKTAGRFVDAVKSGAFALKDFNEWLDKSSGKVEATSKETDTLSGEVTKLWHALQADFEQSPFNRWLTKFVTTVRQSVEGPSIFRAFLPSNIFSTHGPGSFEGSSNANLTSLYPFDQMKGLPGGQGGGKDTTPDLAPFSGARPLAGGMTPEAFAIYNDQIAEMAARLKAAEEETAKFNNAFGTSYTVAQLFADKLLNADMNLGRFAQLAQQDGPQVTDTFTAMAHTIDATDKAVANIGKTIDAAFGEQLAQSSFGQLESAAQYFGISTTHQLEEVAKLAGQQFDLMKNSGVATYRDLSIAALKAAQAQMDADLAAGRISEEQYQRDMALNKQDLAQFEGTAEKKKTILEQTLTETKRLTDQMFRGIETAIASSIIHWKGFGAAIKGVFQTLGQDVLRIFLHAIMAPIEQIFATIISGLVVKLLEFLGIAQAKTAITNVAKVTSEAAVGGAGAAAAAAPLFWWAPELAVAIGAAMDASIMGAFAPLASFAEGRWNVPFDMPANIHAGEMVVPADYAPNVRAAIAGQGPVGTGGGVHFHDCTFNGVTRDLVAAVGNRMIRQSRLAGMNA